MAETRRVLRYFNCRSRGQALRFALVDAGVDFEDVRIPVEDLESFRGDAQPNAPFHSLPVLDWDGYRVAQTLAIAGRLLRLRVDQPRPGSVRHRSPTRFDPKWSEK